MLAPGSGRDRGRAAFKGDPRLPCRAAPVRSARIRPSHPRCELPDDAADQDGEVERAERRLERGGDLRERGDGRDVAVAGGGHGDEAEVEHLRVEVAAFRQAERSGMRALHLAEQERAGGGDHEVAEDRADQAVGACVAVADELGEGRDEGAEDDGQGQRRERAFERGDAEDVGDLEHGRREQQRDRRPRRPAACATGVERAAEDQHEQREPRQAGDGSVRQDRLQDERPDQHRQQETPSPARDEAEIGVDHRHGRRPPGSFAALRPLQIATSLSRGSGA